MIRSEITQFEELGMLPESESADVGKLSRQEKLLAAINKPITDEEALALVKLFGPDDCFGMAWTLLHLIETAPGWPLKSCLERTDNEWVVELRDRAVRAGLL